MRCPHEHEALRPPLKFDRPLWEPPFLEDGCAEGRARASVGRACLPAGKACSRRARRAVYRDGSKRGPHRAPARASACLPAHAPCLPARV